MNRDHGQGTAEPAGASAGFSTALAPGSWPLRTTPGPVWNATDGVFPDGRSVHQLIEAQVERTPDRVAIEFQGERLSYRQLDRRANRLAHHLIALGVGPDVLVGLCVERSIAMVVGVLGILKAGGAYLPLDPAFPQERLAFVLGDSRAPVLVTQGRLHDVLPAHQAVVVDLDSDQWLLARLDAENPAVELAPENLANTLYTSGSTGKPKGVQIPHRALVNFLDSMACEPGLDPDDVLAAVTTLSFDIAGLELFLPLMVGARIVVVGRAVAAHGARLLETLAATRTTVMQATPTTWRLLLEAGWPVEQRLKTILCGGEPLTRKLADQLLARCDALWNLYGPTETTIWSTAQRITPGEGPISIGRPIAQTQVHVVDPQVRPVPIGETGELLIGGLGLARGYLNRPELTAERFIPDPFDTTPGARLYRTGDLARFLPDGTLECLGRADNQVKIRGFRIEPGEIEAALSLHPAVGAAAVVTRPDAQGEPRLGAYLVLNQTPPPTVPDLLGFLKGRLPEYMMPSFFVPLDALPMTPNGKVDRNALPAPGPERPELAQTFVAAAGEDEARLCALWEDVLGIHPIGVEDDFFSLGGDSLLSMVMLLRVEKEFGTKLETAVLLRGATIRQLAGALRGATGEIGSRSVLVQIQPGTAGRQPIFFVHGVGGVALAYRDVLRHMGPEQPFYCFQSPGLDGSEPPLSRVEEMAARYIEAMLLVQARGPFFLGGHSFGGIVVFEIAQQLHALGHEMAYVAIIDEEAPRVAAPSWSLRYVVDFARDTYYWLLDDFLKRSAALKSSWLKRHTRALLKRSLGPLARRMGSESLDLRFHDEFQVPSILTPAQYAVWEANFRASARYQPRPYPGRITLFRNRSQPWSVPHTPDLGWATLAEGGVEVVPVVGDHGRVCTGANAKTIASNILNHLIT
jgi:amino acid adenylation domain-containing protein